MLEFVPEFSDHSFVLSRTNSGDVLIVLGGCECTDGESWDILVDYRDLDRLEEWIREARQP